MADSQGGAIYIKKENAWVLAVEGSASPPAAADGDRVFPGDGITIISDPTTPANKTISVSNIASAYTFVTQTRIATTDQSNNATEALAPFIQIPSGLVPTSARIVRLLVHLYTGQGPAVLYSSTAYGTTTPTSSNIISSRRCHGVSALGDSDNAGSQAFFEMPLMRHNNITVGSNQNYIKFFMPYVGAFPDIDGVMIDGYWS